MSNDWISPQQFSSEDAPLVTKEYKIILTRLSGVVHESSTPPKTKQRCRTLVAQQQSLGSKGEGRSGTDSEQRSKSGEQSAKCGSTVTKREGVAQQ